MPSVYLETFGCQMNELDSELVRSQLRSLGYSFIEDWRSAEVVLFNTCSVRAQAENKAYSRLGLIGQRKKRGERVILGVLGCMAERDGPDMLRRYPQVDLLCGPGELDRLPVLIDTAVRSERGAVEDRVALAGDRSRRSATLAAAEDNLEMLDLSRAFDPDSSTAGSRSAYVRITRGCNKFCTYCVVPLTRGAEVHRPPDHIVEECRRLADAGVLEVTLLGQTVNHYRYAHGSALGPDGREAPQVGPGLSAFRSGAAEGVTSFAQLLARIHDEVPAIRRLRFVTSYPRDFGQDILDVMKSCPRICRYVHAPAQSGSNRILKLMNRGYTVEEYREFVGRLFATLPDATLAGDFIVGFPTESDADFEETVKLVRELPYKNNFIFKYSPRPGTIAIDRFKDDVPTAVKKLRNNLLLAEQAKTSRRVHESWIGREVDVLVESAEPEDGGDSGPPAVSPGGAATKRRHDPVGPRDAPVVLTVAGASRMPGPLVGGAQGAPRGHGQSTFGDPSSDPAGGLWRPRARSGGDMVVALDGLPRDSAQDLVGKVVTVRIRDAGTLVLWGDLVGGLP